jgi:hypothetical protein
LAVAHTGVALLLVPSDPLSPGRADEHFAAEAAAARAAGCDVALVDHDALTGPEGAERAAARVPEGGGAAVYRGWMLSSGQYAALADAVTVRGVTLRTSATQYRRPTNSRAGTRLWDRSPRLRPGRQAMANRNSAQHARTWGRARLCCATTSSR